MNIMASLDNCRPRVQSLTEGTPAVDRSASRRTKMPSRPGEFHPEPLTDPYVNLSIHTARAIARRLPPSAESSGSSRFDPVGPSSTAMTCPLCSTGITPLRLAAILLVSAVKVWRHG